MGGGCVQGCVRAASVWTAGPETAGKRQRVLRRSHAWSRHRCRGVAGHHRHSPGRRPTKESMSMSLRTNTRDCQSNQCQCLQKQGHMLMKGINASDVKNTSMYLEELLLVSPRTRESACQKNQCLCYQEQEHMCVKRVNVNVIRNKSKNTCLS